MRRREEKQNQCSIAIFRWLRFLSFDVAESFGAELTSTLSSLRRCPITPQENKLDMWEKEGTWELYSNPVNRWKRELVFILQASGDTPDWS